MTTESPIHKKNSDPVAAVADALLYEGFLLYPYRSSALKNQQRWNFGVLFPPAYCARQQSGDSSMIQAECLLAGSGITKVMVKIRFLQSVGPQTQPQELASEWLELPDLLEHSGRLEFGLGPLQSYLEVACAPVSADAFRLKARFCNHTPFEGSHRDDALRLAFISTHMLLTIREGSFYSLTDPPQDLLRAKEECRNIGTWPVLVGPEGSREHLLCAPIILYDYPKIAPQSPGNFFDNTEIDEMLSLRILTLTEAEKAQMVRQQESADLLERTEGLSANALRQLHGTLRRESFAQARFKPGDRVRLSPKRRADIIDLALAGRTASVLSVEQDFEENIHVCVTIDDDPGKDLGVEGKPGHRFFFGVDELELL
jgi:hypothetical protein